MDYEKLYKNALERASKLRVQNPFDTVSQMMEHVFPELKESEDEQHRKWILEYLYDGLRKSDEQFKDQFRCAIAWLEKQESLTTDEEKQGKEDVLWCIKQAKKYAKDENKMGTCWFAEQWLEKQVNKPQGKKALEAIKEEKADNANKVERKFKVGDFVKDTNHHKQPIYKIVSIDKECYICESDDVTLGDKAVMHFAFDNPYLRLVEQKIAWNEEDENNLTDTCVAIRKFYHGTNGAQELIDWLKSIKQRKSWKPSEEQIIALRWVLNNIPYNKHKEEISGLLDQIKDL